MERQRRLGTEARTLARHHRPTPLAQSLCQPRQTRLFEQGAHLPLLPRQPPRLVQNLRCDIGHHLRIALPQPVQKPVRIAPLQSFFGQNLAREVFGIQR